MALEFCELLSLHCINLQYSFLPQAEILMIQKHPAWDDLGAIYGKMKKKIPPKKLYSRFSLFSISNQSCTCSCQSKCAVTNPPESETCRKLFAEAEFAKNADFAQTANHSVVFIVRNGDTLTTGRGILHTY